MSMGSKRTGHGDAAPRVGRCARWLPYAVAAAFVIVASFSGLAAGAGRPASAGADLGLAQLAGKDGCVSQVNPQDEDEYAAKGCRLGRGLLSPMAVVSSADGASVYLAAAGSNAVVSFARDGTTGVITEQGCTSQNGTSGVDGTARACADGDALGRASALAASPDNKHVYSASYGSDGVGIFARNPVNGRLTQTGCVRGVRTCAHATGLGGAAGIAVSPDGANVYVAAADADAVVMFARNKDTGALKSLGCISDDGTDRLCAKGNALRGASDIIVSPDGQNVYVAATTSSAVLTFARDPATGLLRQTACLMHGAPAGGSCTSASALEGVSSLVFAPEGTTLFATAYDSNSLSTLSRGANGVLRHARCVSTVDEYDENENGRIDPNEAVHDGCTHVGTLYEPSSAAVTPDGRRLYVAAGDGLTAFDRNPATGLLTDVGCVSSSSPYDEEDGTEQPKCLIVRGISGASDVAVTPDGRNIYLTSWAYDDVVVLGPGASTSARALAGGSALAVRVSCPALHSTPCGGRLALTRVRPRRTLARPRSYLVPAGEAHVYVLPLRRAELKTHANRVDAMLATVDRDRANDTVRRRVVLRGIHVKREAKR